MTKNIIYRTLYINKIKPFIGKNLIKVITGQRRVGKSYLLLQIQELIKEKDPYCNVIYINKEDLKFDEIKNAKDLHNYVLSQKLADKKNYVFIDEIQDIIDFESALRSLLLDLNVDIYCTGSNAHLLSADIAGHLSGRAVEINVYSLTYREFLEFHSLVDSEDSLDKYMRYGGLPYLKHLPLEDEIVFEYLKNIYSSIVFRDVINRFSIRNTIFLEQLVLFLASHIGSLFSAKKISDFLKSQNVKIPPNQVQLYIQHLTSAFLIHPIKRYDLEGKRIFEIGEKYYFENLGIRNALWGYRIQDRGKIIENIVLNQLLASGKTVKVGYIGTNEVDFIADYKGEKEYFQVALTLNEEKTIEREFGNLQKIKDNYPKSVITLDTFSGNSVDGIQYKNLREFLLQ